MALIIVISTGDFQIRWNVLSLSFSERESGKWPLGLSDFSFFDCVIILSVIHCIQNLREIFICNTELKQFIIRQHDFLCRVLIDTMLI